MQQTNAQNFLSNSLSKHVRKVHIILLRGNLDEKNQKQTKIEGLRAQKEIGKKQEIKINAAENNTQTSKSKKKKRKYKAYSIEFKRRVVKEIRRQFEATKKPLFSIIKVKAIQYEVNAKNLSRWFHLHQISAKAGGRKPAYPQLQQKLVDYIKLNPKAKRRQIIEVAKTYLQETQHPQKSLFNFSKGWYERFRARHFSNKEAEAKQEDSNKNSDQELIKIQSVKLKHPYFKLKQEE